MLEAEELRVPVRSRGPQLRESSVQLRKERFWIRAQDDCWYTEHGRALHSEFVRTPLIVNSDFRIEVAQSIYLHDQTPVVDDEFAVRVARAPR